MFGNDRKEADEIMGQMVREAHHRIVILETVIAMLVNKSPNREEIKDEITALAEDCAMDDTTEPASAIAYELLNKIDEMKES
jgi:hypothetical protein